VRWTECSPTAEPDSAADAGKVTGGQAELEGRREDVDVDDDGWTGMVAAALEQRTAKRRALHISAHSDDPTPSTCRSNVIQVAYR